MTIPINLVESITDGGYSLPLRTSALATFGWMVFEEPDSILITDYCARAQERLIEQFEAKQNINSYLCALVTPFQELEYVFGDLYTLRRLDTATAAQLDGLGDIVGLNRVSSDDDVYRDAIRFKIGINFSNGEPESLLSLAQVLTESSEVSIVESYPAGVIITVNGLNITSNTVRQIEQSAPAGVQIILNSVSTEPQFAVAPDLGDIDPDAEGFSEPNYAPDAGKGGHLSEKYS